MYNDFRTQRLSIHNFSTALKAAQKLATTKPAELFRRSQPSPGNPIAGTMKGVLWSVAEGIMMVQSVLRIARDVLEFSMSW